MRSICIELLHYITEAIDNGAPDWVIEQRLDDVANRDDITNKEYCKIYEHAMTAYRVKYYNF